MYVRTYIFSKESTDNEVRPSDEVVGGTEPTQLIRTLRREDAYIMIFMLMKYRGIFMKVLGGVMQISYVFIFMQILHECKLIHVRHADIVCFDVLHVMKYEMCSN